MKTHIKYLMILSLLLPLSCSEEEKIKKCNPRCNSSQYCDNGECKCRDDQFTLGSNCIDRCSTCYEGSIPCGCGDSYIMLTDDLNQHWLSYNHLPNTNSYGYATGGSTAKYAGKNKYKMLIPRSCAIGDKKCNYLELVVDVSDSLQLKVEARYFILGYKDTLAVCSAVFTR